MLGSCFFQEGNVGVRVFPELKEIFVSGECPDAEGMGRAANNSQLVKTPSMRRPVGVKLVLLGFCHFFSPGRAATVATLPSALFDERFVRSVQVGCSRFSRCCHLIVGLNFHLHDGRWARRLTQSPEPGA
jgi:hypothetical protein